MRDIIKPAITLCAICIVVSLSLAFTYSATRGKIVERETMAAEAARKEVLKAAESFEKLENINEANSTNSIVKEIYKGIQGGKTVGYVVAAEPKGYGGAIGLSIGIDTEGKLLGIKIGNHTETPGLGTKAAEPAFKSQLTDILPKAPLTVVKGKKTKPEEIEAISGATITSKAVVDAAQAALDAVSEIVKKEGGGK